MSKRKVYLVLVFYEGDLDQIEVYSNRKAAEHDSLALEECRAAGFTHDLREVVLRAKPLTI